MHQYSWWKGWFINKYELNVAYLIDLCIGTFVDWYLHHPKALHQITYTFWTVHGPMQTKVNLPHKYSNYVFKWRSIFRLASIDFATCIIQLLNIIIFIIDSNIELEIGRKSVSSQTFCSNKFYWHYVARTLPPLNIYIVKPFHRVYRMPARVLEMRRTTMSTSFGEYSNIVHNKSY